MSILTSAGYSYESLEISSQIVAMFSKDKKQECTSILSIGFIDSCPVSEIRFIISGPTLITSS